MPQSTPERRPAQPPRNENENERDRIIATDARDMLRASRSGDEETLASVRQLRFALSLHRVPLSGPARWALIALAHCGADVDVYTPVGHQEAIIWLRPAAPWMDGRHSLDEWRQNWRLHYGYGKITAQQERQEARDAS